MRVVINTVYGGFDLSKEAVIWLDGIGFNAEEMLYGYQNRNHDLLVACVEELGQRANGRFSELKIVEIPDNVEFVIEDYHGVERIAEKHRIWE